MLHSYVHGGLCVAIQYNDTTLIINPTEGNIQQQQRLAQHPWPCCLYTHGEYVATVVVPEVFSIGTIDTSIVVTVAWLTILYYHGDTALEKVLWLSDLDLLLIDFSVGTDIARAVAAITAKTVVPINLTHNDDPIWFCRDVMLHHRGVPKYLKNGQYVVHDIVA